MGVDGTVSRPFVVHGSEEVPDRVAHANLRHVGTDEAVSSRKY